MSSERMQKKMQERLLFWACLGPCMILLIFLIDHLRFSNDQFYLFVALFFGLPLAFQGSNQTLVFSLLLLGASFVLFLPDEVYWHMGICTATALAFVVISLSSQEHQELFEGIRAESKSRLEQLLRLDEKLKKVNENALLKEEEAGLLLKRAEEDLQKKDKEFSALQEIFAALQLELESVQKKGQSLERASELSQKEPCRTCLDLQKQQSLLQQELQQRDQSLYMHMRREAEMKQKIFMQDQLLRQEQEKKGKTKDWGKKIEIIENKLHSAFQSLLAEESIEKPVPKSPIKDPLMFFKHASKLKNFSQEMRDLKQIKALYLQLRKQFNDKSNVLQQSRKDLFFTEIKLESLQLRDKNSSFDQREYEKFYEEQIRILCEENEQYQKEIEELENLLTLIA